MAKKVRVTSAQVNAAKFKVARSAATGRAVSRGVSAIANATRQPTTNASTAVRGTTSKAG